MHAPCIRIESSRVTDRKYGDSEGLTVALCQRGRLSAELRRCQHARNIISGLKRQHSQVYQLIEILAVSSEHRRSDVCFTRVVGCQREFPIAELHEQVVKISRSRVRCLEQIDAVILNLIDTQSVTARRIRHQLPETPRSLGRKCHKTPTALDKDYRRKFGGHATLPQDRFDGRAQETEALYCKSGATIQHYRPLRIDAAVEPRCATSACRHSLGGYHLSGRREQPASRSDQPSVDPRKRLARRPRRLLRPHNRRHGTQHSRRPARPSHQNAIHGPPPRVKLRPALSPA